MGAREPHPINTVDVAYRSKEIGKERSGPAIPEPLGADHIGIVERVNADGSIGTIEGNTENPQTGQEGVWRRTRSMGTVLGFGNPY
jgi:hypothetical protein